jgi:hypothetical protein
MLIVGELLVRPLGRGAKEGAATIRTALSPPWVRQIPFTPDVAEVDFIAPLDVSLF